MWLQKYLPVSELVQAKDTTADLIEVLTLEIMTEKKRHATTKQIHELFGAGLIGPR
jgi:hypothetical protein